jgi:hypothetical protein
VAVLLERSFSAELQQLRGLYTLGKVRQKRGHGHGMDMGIEELSIAPLADQPLLACFVLKEPLHSTDWDEQSITRFETPKPHPPNPQPPNPQTRTPLDSTGSHSSCWKIHPGRPETCASRHTPAIHAILGILVQIEEPASRSRSGLPTYFRRLWASCPALSSPKAPPPSCSFRSSPINHWPPISSPGGAAKAQSWLRPSIPTLGLHARPHLVPRNKSLSMLRSLLPLRG